MGLLYLQTGFRLRTIQMPPWLEKELELLVVQQTPQHIKLEKSHILYACT